MADGPETLILSYEPVNHPTPITFTTCYLNREFALENEGAFAFDINRQDITYRCRFELARNAAATERYWWYAEPPNVQGPDPDLAFGTVASRFPRMGRVWKALEEPPLNIAAMPQREVIWFYVVNNIEFWIYHPGPGRHAHDQAYRIRRFFGTNSAYREFHGLIRGRRDMLPIAGMRGKPKGAKFWAQAKYQYIHMAESLKARPGKDSTVPLGVHLELVVSDEMSDSIRGTYKDYYYEHLRMPSASGRFDESMGPSQGALKSTQRRFFRKDARDVPNKVFDFSPHKDPVKIYELWWDEPNETWLKHKSLKKGGHDRWYKFTVPQSMEIHVSAYLKKVFQESGAPGQSWKVERVEREHHSGGNANPVLFACTDENNSGARERVSC